MQPEPTTDEPTPPPAPLTPLRWWQDGKRLAIIGVGLFFLALLIQASKVPDDPYRRPMGGVVSIPGIGTFAFWGGR